MESTPHKNKGKNQILREPFKSVGSFIRRLEKRKSNSVKIETILLLMIKQKSQTSQ